MVMNCHEVALRLTEFARKQLSKPEQREVAEHLQGCPACQETLFKSQRLSALLRRHRPALSVPAWRAAACFAFLLLWLVAPQWAPSGQPTAAVLERLAARQAVGRN